MNLNLEALQRLVDVAKSRATPYRPALLAGVIDPNTETTDTLNATVAAAASDLLDEIRELRAENEAMFDLLESVCEVETAADLAGLLPAIRKQVGQD